MESASDAADIVEGKLREVFQLRGIALSDVEILSAMDGGDTPWVLPPMYLKSGELKKTARALTMPQLTALLSHARETASSPARDPDRCACDRCDFRAVCRFDPASPDAPFRDLPEMGMEELREALSPAPEEKQ